MDNETIARLLTEHARRLEATETSLYRVRAYRRAAETVRNQERELTDVYTEDGLAGLKSLPDIGDHLAFTLEGLLTTGEFRTLRPIDAHLEPDRLLTSLRGVGPRLAWELGERLGVETVEELDAAARDGRLAGAGLTPRKVLTLHAALEERRQHDGWLPFTDNEPSVADLLTVDGAFRELVRRHRDSGGDEAWLPPFRLERDGWRFRARFARTALAVRIGATRDWVEVHFERKDSSGQRTVVTETRGDLTGRRVVRGRESECRTLASGGRQPPVPA
jgi:hypothetical protein